MERNPAENIETISARINKHEFHRRVEENGGWLITVKGSILIGKKKCRGREREALRTQYLGMHAADLGLLFIHVGFSGFLTRGKM